MTGTEVKKVKTKVQGKSKKQVADINLNCLTRDFYTIEEAAQFMHINKQLAMEGDSTLGARLELIRKRQAVVREQLDQLKETMELLNYKEWYYEQACADGTCDNVNSLSDKDVPAKFRKAKRKFKGQ